MSPPHFQLNVAKDGCKICFIWLAAFLVLIVVLFYSFSRSFSGLSTFCYYILVIREGAGHSV